MELFLFSLSVLLFVAFDWLIYMNSHHLAQHVFATHGCFKINGIWMPLFIVGVSIIQGLSYASLDVYRMLHSIHHKHVDDSLDPHSPSVEGSWFRVLYITTFRFTNLERWYEPLEPDYLEKLQARKKDWYWWDQWASNRIWNLFCFGLHFGLCAWFLPDEMWWVALVYCLFRITWLPLQGSFVNFFGHKKVTKAEADKAPKGSLAKNFGKSLFVSIFLAFENWHGHHHNRPGTANYGLESPWKDPMFWVLQGLQRVGVIRDLR